MRWMNARAASPRHVPQRTCVATRATVADTELLRVVAQTRTDGTVAIVADPRRRLPGRGAWITPTQEAYATAVKRQALSRALRVPATADTTSVRDYIDSLATSADDGT